MPDRFERDERGLPRIPGVNVENTYTCLRAYDHELVHPKVTHNYHGRGTPEDFHVTEEGTVFHLEPGDKISLVTHEAEPFVESGHLAAGTGEQQAAQLDAVLKERARGAAQGGN